MTHSSLVGLEALSLHHDVVQAAAGGGRGRDGVVVVAGHGGGGRNHLDGQGSVFFSIVAMILYKRCPCIIVFVKKFLIGLYCNCMYKIYTELQVRYI